MKKKGLNPLLRTNQEWGSSANLRSEREREKERARKRERQWERREQAIER